MANYGLWFVKLHLQEHAIFHVYLETHYSKDNFGKFKSKAVLNVEKTNIRIIFCGKEIPNQKRKKKKERNM